MRGDAELPGLDGFDNTYCRLGDDQKGDPGSLEEEE